MTDGRVKWSHTLFVRPIIEAIIDQAWEDIEFLVLASEKASYFPLSDADTEHLLLQMNNMKGGMVCICPDRMIAMDVFACAVGC